MQDSPTTQREFELRTLANTLLDKVDHVIYGKHEVTSLVFATLLAGGHALLEDMPGVGKTTLALAFSKLMGLSTTRLQLTPDVMPSDIVGFSMYRPNTGAFEYQPGAAFCNLLLADEINRTSPKTQSALLEVMEERSVTVDGVTREVPDPFFVIATQNASGTAGTQPLPPSQLDRFMTSASLGYPDFESEVALARGDSGTRLTDNLTQVFGASDLRDMQAAVRRVHLGEEVAQYVTRLVRETRTTPALEVGASPRATIALTRLSRAVAWLGGYSYVTPDVVRSQFASVVAHRVQLSAKARLAGVTKESVLANITNLVARPRVKRESAARPAGETA